MGNRTMIRGAVVLLVVLTLFTILIMGLAGENGWINKEIQKYKETHVNEDSQKQNSNVVVVDND